MQAFPARLFLNPRFLCHCSGQTPGFPCVLEMQFFGQVFFFLLEMPTQFKNASHLTVKFNKRLERSPGFIPGLSLTGRGCTCHIHSMLRNPTVPFRENEMHTAWVSVSWVGQAHRGGNDGAKLEDGWQQGYVCPSQSGTCSHKPLHATSQLSSLLHVALLGRGPRIMCRLSKHPTTQLHPHPQKCSWFNREHHILVSGDRGVVHSSFKDCLSVVPATVFIQTLGQIGVILVCLW